MKMILFDVRGDGAAEVQSAVGGLLSGRVNFEVWRPLLPLGCRDVAALIGAEPVEALCGHYVSRVEDAPLDAAVAMLQQCVALFTWLKVIPTLDAQHDVTGRARRIGENEKGLTALEQFKDEENIRRLAYEATDALVDALEAGGFGFWTDSPQCRMRRGLLVPSRAVFDRYYVIGSSRLFVTLTPMIREVQQCDVVPVLGSHHFSEVMAGEPGHEAMADMARRAVVLLTVRKAVLRLPVEVLPEGIVQVQQSLPVKQRMRAEKEARDSVAASLAEDGRRCLSALADMVAALDTPGETAYVAAPIVHSRGMSF